MVAPVGGVAAAPNFFQFLPAGASHEPRQHPMRLTLVAAGAFVPPKAAALAEGSPQFAAYREVCAAIPHLQMRHELHLPELAGIDDRLPSGRLRIPLVTGVVKDVKAEEVLVRERAAERAVCPGVRAVDFEAVELPDNVINTRALVQNVTSKNLVEGASSINQQLARMVYLNQERSFWRKLREVRLAQRLTQGLTKDQILERYLNLVYLGEGSSEHPPDRTD